MGDGGGPPRAGEGRPAHGRGKARGGQSARRARPGRAVPAGALRRVRSANQRETELAAAPAAALSRGVQGWHGVLPRPEAGDEVKPALRARGAAGEVHPTHPQDEGRRGFGGRG